MANNNFQALVQAILDNKSLETVSGQIKGLGSTPVRLRNVTVDTAEVARQIQEQLNGMSFNIRISGLNNSNGGGNGNPIHTQVQSIVNDIDLVNGGLSHMRDMLQGAGFNKSSIQALTNELDRMSITATRLKTTMLEDGSIRMTITGVDELGRAVNLVREFDKETGRVTYTTKTFTQELATSQATLKAMEKINLGIDTGDFQTKLDGVLDNFTRLSTVTPALSNNMASLQTAFETMSNTESSNQERIEAWERFRSLLPIVNAQINQVAGSERDAAAAAREIDIAQQTLTKSSTLSNEILAWMNSNTEAAKLFGNQLYQLREQLSNNTDPTALTQIRLEFNKIKAEAKAATATSSNFGAELKRSLLISAGVGSTVMMVQKLVRTIKEGIKTVTELNDAMVEFRIVTDGTEASYKKFYNTVINTAKEIAGSASDLISSSTVYARLGYSMEESQILAKYTQMLQNVGDVDVTTAQNAITALTKAYGIGVTDIEEVMDKLVVVGNNFPISVEEISTAINNAGSMLASAGNSYEQAFALLTSANTTVQDISRASTGLRTIAARIRNTKAELDDLGETVTKVEYDAMIQALTDYGVSITDVNGEFRSTYDIVQDLSHVWGDLSDQEQAAIAKMIAGRQVPVRTEMCA